MRRLSIAASLQAALLGLTIVLAAVAAIGVASLYSARQTYENHLSQGLGAQAAAARLLAAGVVEEATLRLAQGSTAATSRANAKSAFEDALSITRRLVHDDPASLTLIDDANRAQARLRINPGARGAPLAARDPVARLSQRQVARIVVARRDAKHDSRRALEAIIAGGGLALVLALGLVATLVGSVRRPLEELVVASRRVAGGDREVRVHEDGPEELQVLARSFNAMAEDVQAAAERLESERRRLDITVRSLGDALLIIDPDGTVSAANPRAAQLVPELALGVQTGDDGVALPAPLEAALNDEVAVERDGRTLAVTAARLEHGSGSVWTVRDVSERARLERLKSEFVATASHELRSPLTSIKGFVELLEGSAGLKPRQKEFLEIVRISTDRLVELVNDLLDVASAEAGGMEIHRRAVKLDEIVTETTDLLAPRIAEKKQSLVIDVDSNAPAAFADPDRVRQILVNLLTNAHLYTDEGGTLTVAVRAGPADVVLEISDTGRGMTEQDLEHVFERFYRTGDRENESGSGLGLSIVQSLVELHEGHIEVASAKGEGSTFTVHLPRAGDAPGSEAPSRELLRGKRILIVDDEPELGRLIAEGLAAHGVITELADEGHKALAILAEGRHDAVTLDLLMPGVSGFDILRSLRNDPVLADIPVVVVSVFSGREAISGEWMVAKPIDIDELVDALSSAIAR
jgi:signal transduction histidine kinase